MSIRTISLLALFCAVFIVCVLCEDAAPDTPTSPPEPAQPSVDSAGLSPEQRESMEKSAQQFPFQAEVTRLMDIIINSLYREREIFLRELISNSADACDKIRFESLTEKSKLGEGSLAELDIRIQFDKDSKTISITDKGIGMTKDGLIKNLGVVAHSGTTEFLEKVTSGHDSVSLIGQFGVGFYSVYLVAEKVTVVSKHNDDDQYIWESKADKTFTVVKDPRGNTLGRGTMVVLHLKEDAQEFLTEETLKRIVTRYSEFIQFPIFLLTHSEVEKEVVDEEAEKEAEVTKEGTEDKKEEEKKDDDELKVEEEEEDKKEEKKPKMKKIKEKVSEWKQLNSVKAIWTRNPKDVTEEEYDNFYKSMTKDEKGAMRHIHFKAEGELSFKSILYIPNKAPEGYYDRFYEKSNSLKLYVRKVLISDEFENFMPRYLSFIKGVVDSDDLPLNVNRETLAQSRVLSVMGKKLTRKALEMLKKMSDEKEEAEEEKEKKEEDEEEDKDKDKDKDKKNLYDSFWKEYGKSIKLGVIDDRGNKVALSKLLRYVTNKSDGKLKSLSEYIEDMVEKQKHIYYITGESMDVVKNSPFLEKVSKSGHEVLFMVDPLDEYVVQQMADFDGKKLLSLTKESSDDAHKKLEAEFKDFTSFLKGVYADKVEKIVVSTKLESAPCVLATGKYGWTANLERIMSAQTFADSSAHGYMKAKKTMEINHRHPIISEMKKRFDEDKEDKSLHDVALLMYDAALVSSGFRMESPIDFTSRIHRVMSLGLNIDPNSPLGPEIEDETPEEPKESPPSDESNIPDPEELMAKIRASEAASAKKDEL